MLKFSETKHKNFSGLLTTEKRRERGKVTQVVILLDQRSLVAGKNFAENVGGPLGTKI